VASKSDCPSAGLLAHYGPTATGHEVTGHRLRAVVGNIRFTFLSMHLRSVDVPLPPHRAAHRLDALPEKKRYARQLESGEAMLVFGAIPSHPIPKEQNSGDTSIRRNSHLAAILQMCRLPPVL